MAGKATLQEIEEWWSLEDVLIAHQLMDLEAAAEDKAGREAERAAKRGRR